MYLVAGVVAILAAAYFLTTDTSNSGNFELLDWAIAGMGVVALYRGAKGFRDLRRGTSTPASPRSGDSSSAGPRKIARPGSGSAPTTRDDDPPSGAPTS